MPSSLCQVELDVVVLAPLLQSLRGLFLYSPLEPKRGELALDFLVGEVVNYCVTQDNAASIGKFLPVINLLIEGHVWQSEVLDVLCSIYVPIMNVTATWTSPFSVRKRQVMLDVPTFVTSLGRWLETPYLDEVLAIPIRLVCEHLNELVPSQVTYGSVH